MKKALLKTLWVAEEFDFEKELQRRRKQYKVKRAPNTKSFKLRDPKTGLFLASSTSYSESRFNTNGTSWGSRKAAVRNWESYEFNRAFNHIRDPELELVEYRVTIDEQGKSNRAPTASLCGMYCRVAGFDFGRKSVRSVDFVDSESETNKKNPVSRSMAIFVQYLQKEKPDFKFTHLIELDSSVEMDITPIEHLPFMSGTQLNKYKGADSVRRHTLRFARNGETNYFIAVDCERDFIFVRMGYSEYIVAIADNREIIQRYEQIMRLALPDDI